MKKLLLLSTLITLSLNAQARVSILASCFTEKGTGMEIVRHTDGKVFFSEYDNGEKFQENQIYSGLVEKKFSENEDIEDFVNNNEYLSYALKNFSGDLNKEVNKIVGLATNDMIWVTLKDAKGKHIYGAVIIQSHILECAVENK